MEASRARGRSITLMYRTHSFFFFSIKACLLLSSWTSLSYCYRELVRASVQSIKRDLPAGTCSLDRHLLHSPLHIERVTSRQQLLPIVITFLLRRHVVLVLDSCCLFSPAHGKRCFVFVLLLYRVSRFVFRVFCVAPLQGSEDGRRCIADTMQGCDVRAVSMFFVERDVIMRCCSLIRD